MIVCILLDDRDLQFHVSTCNAHEDITEINAAAILNTKSECVSNVPHEVTIVDSL